MTTTLYPDSRRRFSCRTKTIVALCSLSTLALFLGISPAYAQETTPAQPVPKTADQPAPKTAAQPAAGEPVIAMEQYVVTGLRASLITGQEIKVNAPEFVDSIVAQDIGKLPDNTVADALQRVPGIQVSRAAGEAFSVVIRGLPNLETTLNGYEVYTGTGRGVALQDIPAEMLAGVDAYKSVGPDKIEGGVAGLIDIRLRRPFDFGQGLTFSANGRGIHETQAKKSSYNVSGLVSNRWKTSAGEFGALLDLSYARTRYQDQILDNYVHFGANGELFDLATDSSGTQGYYADNFGWQIIPGDRRRPAASLMLQWKTNSGIELYWDNLFTGYRNDHDVDFFIGIPSWGGYRTNVVLYPAGYGGYAVPEKYDTLGTTPARFVSSFVAHDTVTLTSTQAFHDTTSTYQGALGGKWDHGAVKVTGEVSYNISTVQTKGIILDMAITSPTQALAITYNDGDALTVQASGVDYTSASNYWLTQFYDQWSRAWSGQYAVRSDVLVRLDRSFLKSLQFGGRFSDREVHFHASNGGGDFQWHAAAASSLPGMGRESPSEPFVSASQFSIRQFWSPDPAWLLSNPDTVRRVFGHALGDPPADMAKTFTDTEKTFAVYGLANYKFDMGGMPLDGVIGARFADTHQSLGGYQREILSSGASGTNFVRTHNDKANWDMLPTLNGRLKLTNELFFRYSFTKTETRPNFSALNPALTLTQPTMTLPGQGSGGNPDLDPIKSTNYDASLEYYFSKSSQASIAGYYRTIDGYIQNYGSEETINGGFYTVTRPRNTHNGYLQGIETSYQQFFDFLPDPFKGLGLQANYTYIKGQTENPLTQKKDDIAQVSKGNYNIILIYEKGPFSGRLAYNWRGKFIESFNQSGIQPSTVWVQPTKRLDFSASYAIGKGLTITFDATNILKSKYHDNFGNLPMFSRDVRNYDATYEVGVRYRF